MGFKRLYFWSLAVSGCSNSTKNLHKWKKSNSKVHDV